MKLGIFLQHYFPYGGLQRDAARLARAAEDATLVVSTADSLPADLKILQTNSGGFSNHARLVRFGRDCQALNQFENTISFSRVAGAPFHFCGDPCLLRKVRENKPRWTKLLPRYRTLLKIEARIFGPHSRTHLFFLSPAGLSDFQNDYQLPSERYTILPPWLDRPADTSRLDLRSDFGIPPRSPVLLFVGSNFAHKRLPLVIEATLKTDAHLIVCGDDQSPENVSSNHIHFLGPRDDIPRLMRGADVLLLPSRHETAGMVLTEALAHHLPAICTESCGYAPHVRDAGSLVISANPDVQELTEALSKILQSPDHFRNAAAKWSAEKDRYQTAGIMLKKMALH